MATRLDTGAQPQCTAKARQNLRNSGFNASARRTAGKPTLVCVLAKVARLECKPLQRGGDSVRVFFPVANEEEVQGHLEALEQMQDKPSGADEAVTYARLRQTPGKIKIKWAMPPSCRAPAPQPGGAAAAPVEDDLQTPESVTTSQRKRKGAKPGQPVNKYALGEWEVKGRWALPILEDPAVREDIRQATSMDAEECIRVAAETKEELLSKLYICAARVRRQQGSGAVCILEMSEIGNLSWTKILQAATQQWTSVGSNAKKDTYAYSQWTLQEASLVLARRQCHLRAVYPNFVEAERAEQAAGCSQFSSQQLSQALRGKASAAIYQDAYWVLDQTKRQKTTERGSGTTGTRLYFCFQGHMQKGPHVDDPVERERLGRETMDALKRGGPPAVHELWLPHWKRGWLPPYGTLKDGGFKIDWDVPINSDPIRYTSPTVASPELLQGMSDAVCALRDSYGPSLSTADASEVVEALDKAVAPFVSRDTGTYMAVKSMVSKMVIIEGCVRDQNEEDDLDFTALVMRKLQRFANIPSVCTFTRSCGQACVDYARKTREKDHLVAVKPSLCCSYSAEDNAISRERIMRYLGGKWKSDEVCDVAPGAALPFQSLTMGDIAHTLFVFAGTKSRACLSGRDMQMSLEKISFAFVPHPAKWQLEIYNRGIQEFLASVGILEPPHWFVHPFLSKARRAATDLEIEAAVTFADKHLVEPAGVRGVTRVYMCRACGTGPMAAGSWHAHAATKKHRGRAALIET